MDLSPLTPRPLTSPTHHLNVATICSLILILYAAYYILVRRYASITIIGPLCRAEVGENRETTEELVRSWCGSLKQGFRASWWLPIGHAQTIYSALADFSKDDQLVYQRQLLRLPDGGTIGVDVYPKLCVKLPNSAPVVIVNHGLTGGAHESYIRNLVLCLAKPMKDGGLGARCAVVNFRGCANTPLTSPVLYSSGNTIDNHTATLYLASLFPDAPLVGIGFSLGAAVMTRYMGEQGAKSRLRAAVVLCCPLEFRSVTAKLDSAHIFPRLYSLSMARKILSSIYPHLLPHSALSGPSSELHSSIPEILSLTASFKYKWTLRASKVMELVVTKVGGSGPCFPFEGMDSFMEWACPSGWLGKIKRPTLAISALDDPIVSGDCLPFSAIRSSSHMVLAGVPQGGHLGWFDGPLFGPERHRRWHVRPIIEFLRGVIQTLPKSASEKALPVIKVVEKENGWCWVRDVGWRVLDEDEDVGWAGSRGYDEGTVHVAL
ncbi:anon-23da protein [Cryptococcus wingfieldii CBS 7118]|uniref:Anon-23da protein n=1 Tax=Cryptococcus wingfieldii CBS 7118 TaxID=1295528 RepID=A0A1E3J2P2_9TREE|nr:anon-23da protein [Cryptococcus wingfieldii CBS 7118]ODN94221.1 anon-23da protein [Cryptococcus wingfieldii CBS 7118]